jgi:hypothetical protein
MRMRRWPDRDRPGFDELRDAAEGARQRLGRLRPSGIGGGVLAFLIVFVLWSSWYTRGLRAGPEFYAFSRTLEAYREGRNGNSVMILTTDSDYYRYLKKAGLDGRRP